MKYLQLKKTLGLLDSYFDLPSYVCAGLSV